MKVAALLRAESGIATSLLETVMVIAIVAIISGVALTAALDHLEDAKLSRAVADTEMIGVAIHSFMHDTGFAPAFKSGDARGPEDPIFLVLESAGNDSVVDESLNWPADAGDRERLENQLIKNRPADSELHRYPRMGEISFARFRGWNGPYLANVPSSDPWDNKYLVNIQLATPKGVRMATDSGPLTLETGQRAAVFVISSGPNRQLETGFAQVADSFMAAGDDIVFRIQ